MLVARGLINNMIMLLQCFLVYWFVVHQYAHGIALLNNPNWLQSMESNHTHHRHVRGIPYQVLPVSCQDVYYCIHNGALRSFPEVIMSLDMGQYSIATDIWCGPSQNNCPNVDDCDNLEVKRWIEFSAGIIIPRMCRDKEAFDGLENCVQGSLTEGLKSCIERAHQEIWRRLNTHHNQTAFISYFQSCFHEYMDTWPTCTENIKRSLIDFIIFGYQQYDQYVSL